MFCTECGAQVTPSGRFCRACGSSVTAGAGGADAGEGETIAPATPQGPVRPASASVPRTYGTSGPGTSSNPIGGGRFAPGSIIAGRYRVVALLGRGGMGEVYRAEDLKLSQVVAIKFLPEAFSRDAGALERFHSEVRIARQVSHPNVCRVFDIGETDGAVFLTMEYVDGEDLASLVRRIGRLSPDKAIETGRQICAGLAAAHDKGVIHRDLKPANVMLDGKGKVRITDFGLAAIAATVSGAEISAGTPAYMAPEQLGGREVTARSDLYSLGLVLYEILTGKRAFEAATLPELLKLREHSAPTHPSALVKDLDPLVERVILRCLETDPARRPSSALQVAAALPGGDPLAAALAAGETPSPEMVAAAGESTGLAPRAAAAGLAAVLLGALLTVFVGIRESGLERLRLDNSPEVLEEKAREVLGKLGYPGRPADRASGFTYDLEFLDYAEKNDQPHPDWNRILGERPALLAYWYRQSPEKMLASEFWNTSLTPGVVSPSDPPVVRPGMVSLRLDPEGRLLRFLAVPPQREPEPQPPVQVDWGPLLAAAGLDVRELRPVEPVWTATVAADRRAAWEGTWPSSARRLHVEAGAFHGKPTFFALLGDWNKPQLAEPPHPSATDRIKSGIGLAIAFSAVGGGLWLAYRNYSRGRGDRKGSWVLAGAVFTLEILICLFRSHFVPTLDSLFLVVLAVSTGLFISGLLRIMYLALEPYVRRHWPQTIISWTRLLERRLRDPLVGRDLLFGVLLGTLWTLIFRIGYFLAVRSGTQPAFGDTEYLMGTRETVAVWLSNIVGSILGTLVFFFMLVFLRVVARNRWVASALFVVFFATPKVLGSAHPVIDGIVWVLIYGIAAVSVVRFGLVVLATGTFMANVLLNLPYTLNFSNWYAVNVLLVQLSFTAIAVWGFYASLGGKKLLKDDLFE